jgi:hypothetical protein
MVEKENQDDSAMKLFTERHGMRNPIEHTSTISIEMYSMLFKCCEKYYDNIAWKYPAECPDWGSCYGLNVQDFNDELKYRIPKLFRDSHDFIANPRDELTNARYDQYALLDFVEFIGKNCRDIEYGDFCRTCLCKHISLLGTNNVAFTFRNEINDIFKRTGLLYILTDKMTIERVTEYSTVIPEVEAVIASVKDPGLKELLDDAITRFKQPNPMSHKDAVEKLWDAFERLKTYYNGHSKKDSATKIVADMSGCQSEFSKTFSAEFCTLTEIGNKYRIRHHETDKIEIQDMRHYDYFFNRCLALIATALPYLE